MRRIARLCWSTIDIVMAVLLAAMIVLVFANVVLRYGFSSGIRQSVELARLWFVWVVMLFIGALNQTMANWGNISQLTGLPSALFYLAGVVSAVLMGAVAVVRLIDPMAADACREERE